MESTFSGFEGLASLVWESSLFKGLRANVTENCRLITSQQSY